MTGNKLIQIAQIRENLNLAEPCSYRALFLLSSNSASSTQTIKIGDKSCFINSIKILGLDTTGKLIEDEERNARDWFYINIKDSDAYNYQVDPLEVHFINELSQTLESQGLGWYLRDRLELTIEIAGASLPAGAILTFPVKFMLVLSGFKLFQNL